MNVLIRITQRLACWAWGGAFVAHLHDVVVNDKSPTMLIVAGCVSIVFIVLD